MPQPKQQQLDFVCAEVWGGNRSIDAPIQLPGVRGRLYSQAAQGHDGGDVHCLSICDSGLIARMILGDVVGHGEEVAAVGREIHELLRSNLNAFDQRRLLQKLNRRLAAGGFGQMTTAAALTYFPPTRSLAISYAGHPPGWWYRQATARWERLTLARPGPDDAEMVDVPLAIDDTSRYTHRKQRVRVGDRLLLVTDGVLEAPGPDGELFGADRVSEVLAAHAGGHPDTLAEALLTAVREHTGDPDLPHDDVSLLTIEFVPGPRNALWHMVKNRLGRPKGTAGAADAAAD